ncbi:MAG: response regulator [Anaerolineae bacterium]|nr:response regulator [Anaerolineae bacterium]
MLPEAWFAAEVRDVLDHLYDYPYLQTHPLAGHLHPDADLAPRERMHLLRSTVINAIEELNPGPAEPFRSLRARPYSVLNLRYVEGLSITELARELAVSERQVYRDLHRAEQDLATLLWTRCRGAASTSLGEASRAQLILSEAERLPISVEEVCLQPLLQGTLDAVARLGEQRGVPIEAELPGEAIAVRTDRMLAKQALVATLSHAVQQAEPGTAVTVAAHLVDSAAQVQITFLSSVARKAAATVPVAAQQLVARLGGRWTAEALRDGRSSITLALSGEPEADVLVIDDNEGLLELFQRYLLDKGYRLMGAYTAHDGLRLALQTAPDIIVLDVMMPGQDGWDVLQQLRSAETTQRIPVIVCSVLDDPQLALSLGATEFLAKPVNRDQLLKALARCRPDTHARSRPVSPAGT